MDGLFGWLQLLQHSFLVTNKHFNFLASVAFGYPIESRGVLVVDYIVLAFFSLDIILGITFFN